MMCRHFAPQEMKQALETVRLEGSEAADVDDRAANHCLVEKRHAPDIEQHPAHGFSDQCDVQHLAAGPCLVEADRVAQNGLAGSGRALDVETAFEETAPQKRV
jgi:hypothetical protein